jgi:uncharacterized protein
MTVSTNPDEDYPVTHSPLERTVTRDAITVGIRIYRGNEDPGWNLEIEDQNGGSTIWEDLPSDQEALDLAMKTIDEEGIASFAESMKKGSGKPGTQVCMEPLPLDDNELAELEGALGERSLASVIGMLAAVVSVPEVLPSQLWLGALMAKMELKDAEQAQRFAGLIMRLNNHVATAFLEGDPMRICPADRWEGDHRGDQRGDGEDGHADEEDVDEDRVAEFCNGYLSIVRTAGIDMNSDGLLQLLERIAEGKEVAWGESGDFDAVLGSLYACWRPNRYAGGPFAAQQPITRGPKIGRNDQCPCGSGNKFKKCHGAPS